MTFQGFQAFHLFSLVATAVLSVALASFVFSRGRGKAPNRVIAAIAFASFWYNFFKVVFYLYPDPFWVRIG
ncbi:MAG TPA: hypothetical protein PK545_07355, partial [Deltaproteobacteria bacterium]|nr:hypothetical protein [Deltaproteobacteria bacterium]